jgi:tRNA-specific 2-thiouridylase
VSGDIVTRDGKVLGRHRGLLFYTIGQRSGLGISAKVPLYVVAIDATGNRIVVGPKEDLLAPGLWADDLNLLTDRLPEEADAKIRYRKKPARCRITMENGRLRALFSEPQESITPGQAVVLYEGDRVLGGGVIEEVIHDTHR